MEKIIGIESGPKDFHVCKDIITHDKVENSTTKPKQKIEKKKRACVANVTSHNILLNIVWD